MTRQPASISGFSSGELGFDSGASTSLKPQIAFSGEIDRLTKM